MSSRRSRKAPVSPTTEINKAKRITKKRASRACAVCRTRKVRCDVTQRQPCSNCEHDQIDCTLNESRRRKKNKTPLLPASTTMTAGPAEAFGVHRTFSNTSADGSASGFPMNGIGYGTGGASLTFGGHVAHPIYNQSSAEFLASPFRSASQLGAQVDNASSPWTAPPLVHTVPWAGLPLPGFIKPLPPRIAQEDVHYLGSKGALMLPASPLQNHLLRAYVEFVHPFMPVLDLHDFLDVVNSEDGACGQVSLLLYQAVMFVATAFVEGEFLREAGFHNRRDVRKVFFQKARLLYDFDYETDRLVLVQALLLMTYWYETPDDQKDTWHWMGIAISLAHTIGLNNNLTTSAMSSKPRKLRRRVWWSCFMRDRLVALGMRRPTRLKDEDFDVPMLEVEDFDLQVLSHENRLLPPDCTVIRDLRMQEDLAQMCVEKAKLCVIISRMLKAQYSVLNRYAVMNRNPTQSQSTESSTMMLFPNKTLDNLDEVNNVDEELDAWSTGLPESCTLISRNASDVPIGSTPMVVQRNLLHMVYHTTVSALHRPLILPHSRGQPTAASHQTLDMARMRVHHSAEQVTKLLMALAERRLDRYLPTTGVTVILPTMIIHLFSMRDENHLRRVRARKNFEECMKVLLNLSDIYAAAEFGARFLNAALHKAAFDANEPEHSKTQALIALASKTALDPGLNLNMHGSPSGGEAAGLMQEPMPYSPSVERSLLQQPVPQEDAAFFNGTDGSTPLSDDYSRSPGSSSSESISSSDSDAGNDWNLGSGGMPFDFDQWLQFPVDGVQQTDGAFFAYQPFDEPHVDAADYMDFQGDQAA